MLENKCLLEVKGAEDKKTARPGVIYFAPSDYHLLVESNGDLTLSSEEAVNYSRPSIAAAGGIALVEAPPPPPTPRGGARPAATPATQPSPCRSPDLEKEEVETARQPRKTGANQDPLANNNPADRNATPSTGGDGAAWAGGPRASARARK